MDCGTEQNFVSMLESKMLKDLNNSGKERIRDFRNDQAEGLGASGDERASLRIWVLA